MRALLALAALFVCLVPAPVEAVKHRRPYHPNVRTNAGYDNNGGGGCTDHACGGNCYDGHSGTDFNLGIGTDVLAGADGTVTEVVMGCANYGGYCSPCGGRCGNHVRLQHDDGSASLFCHMKDGSIIVGRGQRVGCGQKLGESASSGCSTGPHLHFGFYPNGGWNARDPFGGRCSNHGGGWTDDGPYGGSPGTDCENRCQCNPGETERGGCGRCGTHTRSCGGDCRWGGWSACEGEGPCSPGDQMSQACCDCGSQTRTCNGACQWDDWGACGGPDPAGDPPCPTGVPGDCATGAIRCVSGCLMCVQTVFPQPEVCDAHDNDCDGPTDEEATVMGDPPPPYAAQLEDLSAPEALRPGESARIWAVFRNVGTAPWPARGTWLGAAGPDDETPSPLGDAEIWAAHDAPVGVTEAVAPGESATVVFPVHMPRDAEAVATSRFDMVVQGAPILCPEPGFDLDPVRLTGGHGVPPAVELHAPERAEGATSDEVGSDEVPEGPASQRAALRSSPASCGVTAGGRESFAWLLLALPALVTGRRRRR